MHAPSATDTSRPWQTRSAPWHASLAMVPVLNRQALKPWQESFAIWPKFAVQAPPPSQLPPDTRPVLPKTGVRTVAGALAHVALIAPARERALAAVLGYVSGVFETGRSLDARAHAHVALVLSTRVLAIRRRGPNAG